MANLTGKTLKNRYRVDEFIGRGGMADVYKVWDQQRADYLAMKVLHADLAQDRLFIRRFQREAQTLAKLQHSSIVRFYGLEQEGLNAFILMDFVDGDPLRAEIFLLEGRPMPVERIRQVLRPVCSALYFAHQSGLVHCDIKPANIMTNRYGQVFVSDFGIARTTETVTTATMVGMGTPAYMAPEQAKGLDPSPQTDIYALGIILYEMLTGGERPFTGEKAQTTGSTSEKVRWEQIKLQPPSPRVYNPSLSPALEAVVLKCLAKEPKARFASALELLNALELALGDGTQPVPVAAEVPSAAEQAVEEARKFREENQRLKVELENTGQAQPQEVKIEGKAPLKEKPAAGRRLPGWVWIAAGGGGLLVLLLLVNLLGGGSRSGVAFLARETPTLTATATSSSTQTQTPTPSLTPTPELGIVSTQVSSIDGMVMVYVPAGDFEMGSEDGDSDEKPVHTVYLDAYWIDQTEVTNEMYEKCVQAGACEEPGSNESCSRSSYYGNTAYDNYPVIYVDWYAANDYCEWAGRRLPTEAEWEKAARGTDGRTYPWGEGIDNSLANYSGFDTTEAGSYPKGASPYGALDMAGNVWEWVDDAGYYSASSENNPQGPTLGETRVLRGGSWTHIVNNTRSANRLRDNPSLTWLSYGFRCVLSAP